MISRANCSRRGSLKLAAARTDFHSGNRIGPVFIAERARARELWLLPAVQQPQKTTLYKSTVGSQTLARNHRVRARDFCGFSLLPNNTDRRKKMDRFEKAQREEERWQFSQQAGLFESVFSRRIFGPLWWWWLFVVYFLSILLTTEPGQPFRRSFYMAVFLLVASTVWIAAILLPKERRALWVSRQQPVSVPLFARVGIHTIPWLGLGTIIWCAFAR